jgi:hypothetical protein
MALVDIIAAAGLAVTAIAAILAFIQLREAKNIARAQFLLAVDQSLAPFEQLRREINRAQRPSDWVQLRRYVAAFERIGLLLREQHLRAATVDQLYGDRFRRLVTIRDGELVAFVRQSPDEWEGFVWLWQDLQTLRGLPTPPSLSRTPNNTAGKEPIARSGRELPPEP